MRLDELVSTDFVLLRADEAAGAALTLLARSDASHVIVDGCGGPESWYLLSFVEARDALAAASPGATVAEVLGLDRRPATLVVDGALPAAFAPPRAIVMAEGRARGFIDTRGSRAKPPIAGTAPALAGAEFPLAGAEPPLAGADFPLAGAEPPRPAESHLSRAKPPAPAGVRRGLPTRPGAPSAAGAAAPVGRSLEAEFPERVRVDSVAWLLVYIANQAPSGHGLGLDVGPGEVIDVLVQPRTGFTLEGGDDRGSLTVPASGESLPLQFKLKGLAEGPGEIRILAFHTGEPLGAITLGAVVEPASAPHLRGAAAPVPRRSKPLATPSPALPDLTMFVEEWQADGATQYRILLSATDPSLDLNLRTFGPLSLRLDPAKFFEDFFKEIDDLPLDTEAQRELAERRLGAKGAYLTDQLLPDGLRDKLWEVRDRISSIIVQSEEPWIPWELCKLVGRENGRIVEGPFLCEAYPITRWLPGVGFKRPLSLRNVALVVPADSGLPLAGAERDYVLSLAGPARHVTALPATFAGVQDAFAAGTYDGWHFTGHGAARDDDPDRSPILLEGGQAFTPDSLSGQAANVGLPHPVVFINACQVGRSGMALTGIGGWANRFVQAGAGAFIGAYWSVIDEPAFGFAREVYTRLLAGTAIGQAVREARIAIRSPGDPTWLAYTVFADPLATISA